MKLTFFSTQTYDKTFFEEHNKSFGFAIEFFEVALSESTANLIDKSDAICVFVNDRITLAVIKLLAAKGVKVIALRCAGFNNVDLMAAVQYNIRVVRVPAYSPHAVAEHAAAMIMTLNRKTHKAYNRIREQNFSLSGLMGFDLFGKTIGVIGTGNIGMVFCKIMLGFGCRVVAYDIKKEDSMIEAGVIYVPLDELLSASDIVSLHCPLNKETHYLINQDTIGMMKNGAMLINTSRGGLIDTKKVIKALKSGKLGALGIDVYEQEETLFFQNLSEHIIADDVISRLISFPNVLITSHQGFFTKEAMDQIASTTLANLKAFESGAILVNEVKISK
ncbi:MAG: 2-hydroxyacid dehydrogenase [Cyclobacteriaceae bacterium]|jgi:D-lactate dehydrogenase|nr:2-hydroxyacid dehydrogenase [Cyclobacteriaceae bacterium]MDH4296770.1 2-hydroxyacid dehydrogenase [Cyclobacteriaceae bacterium]MDH5248674.1 2-hydroxyacid dehydrogenase [Cyclobacteriaceae bacterium]